MKKLGYFNLVLFLLFITFFILNVLDVKAVDLFNEEFSDQEYYFYISDFESSNLDVNLSSGNYLYFLSSGGWWGNSYFQLNVSNDRLNYNWIAGDAQVFFYFGNESTDRRFEFLDDYENVTFYFELQFENICRGEGGFGFQLEVEYLDFTNSTREITIPFLSEYEGYMQGESLFFDLRRENGTSYIYGACGKSNYMNISFTLEDLYKIVNSSSYPPEEDNLRITALGLRAFKQSMGFVDEVYSISLYNFKISSGPAENQGLASDSFYINLLSNYTCVNETVYFNVTYNENLTYLNPKFYFDCFYLEKILNETYEYLDFYKNLGDKIEWYGWENSCNYTAVYNPYFNMNVAFINTSACLSYIQKVIKEDYVFKGYFYTDLIGRFDNNNLYVIYYNNLSQPVLAYLLRYNKTVRQYNLYVFNGSQYVDKGLLNKTFYYPIVNLKTVIYPETEEREAIYILYIKDYLEDTYTFLDTGFLLDVEEKNIYKVLLSPEVAFDGSYLGDMFFTSFFYREYYSPADIPEFLFNDFSYEENNLFSCYYDKAGEHKIMGIMLYGEYTRHYLYKDVYIYPSYSLACVHKDLENLTPENLNTEMTFSDLCPSSFSEPINNFICFFRYPAFIGLQLKKEGLNVLDMFNAMVTIALIYLAYKYFMYLQKADSFQDTTENIKKVFVFMFFVLFILWYFFLLGNRTIFILFSVIALYFFGSEINNFLGISNNMNTDEKLIYSTMFFNFLAYAYFGFVQIKFYSDFGVSSISEVLNSLVPLSFTLKSYTLTSILSFIFSLVVGILQNFLIIFGFMFKILFFEIPDIPFLLAFFIMILRVISLLSFIFFVLSKIGKIKDMV